MDRFVVSGVSNCCNAPIDSDTLICMGCKDHASELMFCEKCDEYVDEEDLREHIEKECVK